MRACEVYIVHVWTDAGTPAVFRAAVQRAGTDQSAWFTEIATLARFFATQSGVATNAGETTADTDASQ